MYNYKYYAQTYIQEFYMKMYTYIVIICNDYTFMKLSHADISKQLHIYFIL